MKIEVVRTKGAAELKLPLSQAVRAGSLVYTYGAVPIDLEGQVVKGGIEEQTRAVIESLKAILEAADTSLANVIKATVFLKDFNDFDGMNWVYMHYFGPNYPARTTVQVSRLYKDVRVEIEVVAAVP